MIDFSSTILKNMTLHHVGNKSEGRPCVLAKECSEPDDGLRDLILDYFLNAFKQDDLKRFDHEKGLEFNPVFAICQKIFADAEEFVTGSSEVVEYLYGCSEHPYVKQGSVFIFYFSELIFDEVITDAVGIFKIESRNPFMTVNEGPAGLAADFLQGFDPAKIDKGCLVLATAEDMGYRVLTLNRKKDDDGYWHHRFLGVRDINKSRRETAKCLDLCMGFSNEILPSLVEKEAQFEFNSAALDFFEQEPVFDYLSFTRDVLQPFSCKDQFAEYVQTRPDDTAAVLEDPFEIHDLEVKKAKRKMKNIIKLDTRIEVKLNAKDVSETVQYLERGYDEGRKMYFYKLYYNHEVE